jgi:hypothetical protein
MPDKKLIGCLKKRPKGLQHSLLMPLNIRFFKQMMPGTVVFSFVYSNEIESIKTTPVYLFFRKD